MEIDNRFIRTTPPTMKPFMVLVKPIGKLFWFHKYRGFGFYHKGNLITNKRNGVCFGWLTIKYV